MALTEEQQHALFTAFDRASAATRGADEATRTQALLQAIVLAAGDVPLDSVLPVLHEYELRTRQRGSRQAILASEAVIHELQCAGVATPGELLAQRGLATLPALLATLGFTGDLHALAEEVEAALGHAT